MSWSRKKTIAAALAAVLAGGYAGGVSYFSNHTFPNTTVDGKEASMMKDAAVLEQVRADSLQGTLNIKVQDKTYTLNVPEVLSIADDGAVLGAVSGSRNPYAWPLEVFRRHDLSSGRKLAFNSETGGKLLEEQGLFGLDIAPVDAKLSEFSEEQGYTVVPDADGWKGDRDAVLEAVRTAAEAEGKEIDLTKDFAVKAAVLSDNKELNEEKDELNSLVHHSYRLKVGDAEQTLSGETLNGWLKKSADGRMGLDAEQITAYAEGLQEQFGDTLEDLKEKNGQRYIVDHKLFTNILTSRIGVEMPEPETESQKNKRESANEKLKKQAEKDAKKAKTEEEKAAIMAEAEAKMTPAPEMIALPAADEEAAGGSAGEADKAEKSATGATPANAETAGPKPDRKSPEAEQEEQEEEKPDYTKALLTGGLYIENPVTEEAEQEREEKAAKEVPLATRPNALLPDDPEEEKPESGTPSDADRTPVTVTMAENEIHIPLLEADPGFELGYGFDYVEVDIGRQHVTLFENCRKVMESDCVTGIPNKARATHPGVFKIDYKQRNRILRGSQNLYASFVNYWMPFDGGIGLHDATWRGTFGGEIYKYSGSHGCVNLPLSFAKKLYAHVYPGETVYVHY